MVFKGGEKWVEREKVRGKVVFEELGDIKWV